MRACKTFSAVLVVGFLAAAAAGGYGYWYLDKRVKEATAQIAQIADGLAKTEVGLTTHDAKLVELEGGLGMIQGFLYQIDRVVVQVHNYSVQRDQELLAQIGALKAEVEELKKPQPVVTPPLPEPKPVVEPQPKPKKKFIKKKKRAKRGC
jgi:hypothetical protein